MRAAVIALVLVLACPATAQTQFDGKWMPSLTFSATSSSSPECTGFIMDSALTIANGVISGNVSHDIAGYFEVSGRVASDGRILELRAVGQSEVVFKGTLRNSAGQGTWEESDYGCDGTWSFLRQR